MASLEQSTRYIAYDARLDGRYRYWRDPQVLDSPLGARYVAAMDALFDGYAAALPKVMEWARQTFPKEPADSDLVWRQTIKAKACDAVRGMRARAPPPPPRGRGPGARPVGHAGRFRPRRRGQGPARLPLPRLRPPGGPAGRRGAHAGARGALPPPRRLRGAGGQPPPQAR